MSSVQFAGKGHLVRLIHAEAQVLGLHVSTFMVKVQRGVTGKIAALALVPWSQPKSQNALNFAWHMCVRSHARACAHASTFLYMCKHLYEHVYVGRWVGWGGDVWAQANSYLTYVLLPTVELQSNLIRALGYHLHLDAFALFEGLKTGICVHAS